MIKNKIKIIIEKDILLKPKIKNNYHIIDNGGSWIFDFRKGFLNPNILDIFCNFFWDNYGQYYPFQVGGIESGGIPFVTGIILEGKRRGYKDISGFYIRKQRKEKGLGNIVEGPLNNQKIIIVDDVLNGGDSIYCILKALSGLNKNIFKAFVFINFGNPKGQSIIKENFIDLEYLYTLSDFGLGDFVSLGFGDNPIIYPKLKKLFTSNNQNLFIDVPKSNPILLNNYLYFGGEGGDFYCISKDTGDIIWKTILPKTKGHKNILSSPIIIENNIVFGNYDGNIYFLDIKNGKINYIIETIADFIGSSPYYDKINNIIYIGLEHASSTYKGSFVAIDYVTKKIIWEYKYTDFVHSSPIFITEGNIVICGGNDGKILGISSHGEKIFDINLLNPVKGSFVSDKQNIYFGSHDKNFYCINYGGEIKWKLETENIIYTKPLIYKNHLFFGGLDKNFYHIDNNGKIIQKLSTSGKIFGEPIIIEKNIISFSSNDGFIYFYDYNKENIVYCIYHGEKINNKMIYEKKYGFLYTVDYVGGVYKYNIKKYIG